MSRERRGTTPSAAAQPPPLLAKRGGERRRLGLIVNPIAGMGGRVGLKGTDGAATLAQARERGAEPVAADRAIRALTRLREIAGSMALLAGGGVLGADTAHAAGLAVETAGTAPDGATSAEDTKRVARALVEHGAELIVFAGGDGTARDVHDAIGPDMPMLGIPTGVKMHSGVFATSPEAAGQLLALIMRGEAHRVRLREAEIMDLDEDSVRAGRVSARLHGVARVPYERSLVQNGKAPAGGEDDDVLEALAASLVRAMALGTLHVLGCGTTMRRIKRRLGSEGTLLGVDVARDGRLVAEDVDEAHLRHLLDEAPAAAIVTGVTGGQGFVFGRGNQQISPAVIRRVGRENITVICGRAKLMRLVPPCLRVDSGDAALDAALAGYIQVHTAPGQTMMMPISA